MKISLTRPLLVAILASASVRGTSLRDKYLRGPRLGRVLSSPEDGDEGCRVLQIGRQLFVPSVNGVVGKPEPKNLKMGDVIAQESFLCDGNCQGNGDRPDNEVGMVYATATIFSSQPNKPNENNIDARLGTGGYYLNSPDKYGVGAILFKSLVQEADVTMGFPVAIVGGTKDFAGATGSIHISVPDKSDPKRRLAAITVCTPENDD